MSSFIKSLPMVRKLNNQTDRDEFVVGQLKKLAPQSNILDAGCGSQRYRQDCTHLNYKSQDFGEYKVDEKKVMGSDGVGGRDGYKYGQLDYVGDIWEISEEDEAFDTILCTEVFEHIPYPVETVKEFSRLLKPNGTLILTAPSNCLRHMDPYFFYSGFSNRWYEKVLTAHDLTIESLETVGDYYSWLAVEMARTAAAHSIVAKVLLAPAFLYYHTKPKTTTSADTLCMGYHVLARKHAETV
jgi:SAM-dependent methyltransferase